MITPTDFLEKLKNSIKKEWKTAFLAALLVGLAVHLPIMLSDIPNHDGLDSVYFDQNMITSGRWFLMVACGFSSFYSLPWVIGLISMALLGLTAAAIVELLQVKKTWAAALIGALTAVFPALASTFAYVFTMDGYMLGLLLAVLAVLFTAKSRLGFLPGAVCLAFSMGIYQAYLPVAMILCIFSILLLLQGQESPSEKVRSICRYPAMGAIGVALYYIILQILLKLQGKELASYQGIDGMVSGEKTGILQTVYHMYRDFLAFTLKGNVLFNNALSAAALLLLAVSFGAALLALITKKKWWKSPMLYLSGVTAIVLLPPVTNIILLVSPGVTYHLLMRYQWVLYLIGMLSFVSRQGDEEKINRIAQWAALAAALVLVFFYGVTDNIGYSNLEKRYEKTYAYCVRLLDRIEQTEGYYQGIPIAMIGVVGTDAYPSTDVTAAVTSNMIGLNGDSLLYTCENYRKFMEYYLGATLNIQPAEAMSEMYYDERYREMETFPGSDSVKIIDGVMYVKTENVLK